MVALCKKPFEVLSPKPATSPSVSPWTARQRTFSLQTQPLVTTGISEHYIQTVAAVSARANATDPLMTLVQAEALGLEKGPRSAEVFLKGMWALSIARLRAKIAHGAFIAEAANFAAVLCFEPRLAHWEPPSAADQPIYGAERPVLNGFLTQLRDMKRRHLSPVAEKMSGGRYWELCLVTRDPAREYVPGAVRAVVVPFIEAMARDEIPWPDGTYQGPVPVELCASSRRARDVYEHLGFEEVGCFETSGRKSWLMIYTGSSNKLSA
ncbi:hypothetical protein F5Y15DRAFT_150703 [Xylariaceae sp. FL0016]|nr:hypothetical protein F5Y15DRAFT_150703 [Xylariaceae sp. FL0016]